MSQEWVLPETYTKGMTDEYGNEMSKRCGNENFSEGGGYVVSFSEVVVDLLACWTVSSSRGRRRYARRRRRRKKRYTLSLISFACFRVKYQLDRKFVDMLLPIVPSDG